MMRTFNPEDNIHKAWLFRILEAIADNHLLAQQICFKGGTCASMRGFLDRFSVDLDFDYRGSVEDIPTIRTALETIFTELGLRIKDKSKRGIQYFLKYEHEGRNTIKIDVSFPVYKASVYEPAHFDEIDKTLLSQTRETMVAHKMCALMDRFEKTKTIAGRDIYDIHYFLMKGYTYTGDVITERTGLTIKPFLEKLITFIEREVTEKIITEDISFLVDPVVFKTLRKTLKKETSMLVRDEVAKW